MNFTTKYPVVVFFVAIIGEKIYLMKKIVTVIFLFLGLSASAQGLNEHYKSALDKRIKFYALYHNTLQLTPEQVSQFEYIVEIYNNKYDDLLKNNIKFGDIRRISKQEDREIKQILDKRQRKRFNLIRHLERFDLNKGFKEKDYYKLNPRMSVFGDLQKK